MSTPLVSVIIDNYNYGRFIEEAIESVLSQDFPHEQTEILVVDDGSTDDTAERVKKFETRVQYFYKANGGQASAFNYGFARAHGEIICFLDADDYWLPGKLRRVVKTFESGSAGMVSNDYRFSVPDASGNVNSNMDLVSGDISSSLDMLLRHRAFPTSCLAFRRSTLDRLLPISEAARMHGDAFLALLAVFVAPIVALPEVLTIYRVHTNNAYAFAQKTAESQERDSSMRKLLVDEMGVWLRGNGFQTRTGMIRKFLDQWLIYQQVVEFSIAPPTRLQWCSHLLRYNRTYRTRQSWKLTVLNYLSAIAALVWGYKLPRPQQAPTRQERHV